MGLLDDLGDGFDPSDLLGSGAVREEDKESSALQTVANRISAQYAEIIATWSAGTLSSKEPVETSGMVATVHNVLRLARSSEHQAQIDLLEDLLRTLDLLHGTVPNSREGDSARVRLRDWIPSFADTLEGDDAERLRSLVEWDASHMPFLEELLSVRGVGPRRLTRLHSAGLGQLDAVANADPEEVAQVTGIPLAIAEEVVTRARAYALEERERCVSDIRERAQRLRMLLTSVSGDPDVHLVQEAQQALRQVEEAFRSLPGLLAKPPSETP